ncbi:MAG: hypothetical protein ACYSWU_10115 [Planctomycetota bacterium]|jgi:hypothetical protein
MAAETNQQDSPAEPTLAELAEQSARAEEDQDDQAAADDEQTPEDEGDETTDQTDEDASGEEEHDPKAIAKLFDETFGRQEAGKFSNDMEFLRGYDELLAMRGRKDEDASLGKQVRERLGQEPDELLALLSNGNKASAKPAEDSLDFDQSWIQTDEKGKITPAPGAPPDTMDRHAAWTRDVQAFTKNPKAYIREQTAALVEKLEKRLDDTDQQIVQRQQESALDSWCEGHRKELYLDGDPDNGLTTHGKELSELAAEFIDPAKHDVTKALDKLWGTVLKGAPKPSKRSIPGRAKRKPAVATRPSTATDEKQLEEQLAQKGLAAVLAEQAAAAG